MTGSDLVSFPTVRKLTGFELSLSLVQQRFFQRATVRVFYVCFITELKNVDYNFLSFWV